MESLEPGEINVIGESLVETQLHTSINDYLGAKHLFEEQISSKKWSNFSDFLIFYNKKDTVLLEKGFQSYLATFNTEFENCNPLLHISLPSIASKLMWSHYDAKSCYDVFTFGADKGWLNEKIRENLRGGYVGKSLK